MVWLVKSSSNTHFIFQLKILNSVFFSLVYCFSFLKYTLLICILLKTTLFFNETLPSKGSYEGETIVTLEIDPSGSWWPKNNITVIISKDIFPDKATERKILSMAIRCPNDGCEWTGELRNKKVKLAHISMEATKQLYQHKLLFSSVELTKPQI